ncbi:MAG: hypothetical protein CL969_04425 [Euryarchaeota archaeon]|jgi:hypothetical protein|nr:hypothetical protein [Euryarchaeota archaeon]MDP6378346.1 hypothetical protein [Candidatus Thalassarchaeaceae archaeon]|tara:strand:+ start:1810 stop:2820 length:1011 start_codon:yes stop_codon:yes gene_type:complete
MLDRLIPAHVRWFIDSEYDNVNFEADLVFMMIITGAILTILAFPFMNRSKLYLDFCRWIDEKRALPDGLEWRLVSGLTGMMLLINTFSGDFVAPNIEINHPTGLWIALTAQTIVALLLLFHISYSISGALILVALVPTVILIPLEVTIDYAAELVSLSLALIFIGPSISRVDRAIFEATGWEWQSLRQYALPTVRVGVGLTLITLALHNKLLDPAPSMAFIAEHNWNFFPMIGMDFVSDLNFVLFAGITEMLIGVAICFNQIMRWATILIALLLTTTLLILGYGELVGHLPLFGLGILFVLKGGGSFDGLFPKDELIVISDESMETIEIPPVATEP